MRTVTKILAALGLVGAVGIWRHRKQRPRRQHVNRSIDAVLTRSSMDELFIGSTNEVPGRRIA